MVKIVLIIVAIGLLLFLIDRFCLWLESKDLLYYRHKKPLAEIVGNALQELQGILNPGSRHVIEVKQNQVQYNKRHKENDIADDNQGKKYDKIASGFAKMRDSFAFEQKYLDLLISHLKPESDILDVGCGSGRPIAAYLLEHGFKVTGVDASSKILKIAQTNYPALECLHGDMRTILLNKKYNAIVEWWSLMHIPAKDHEKMIARFAGWLKPGGILEFTTGDRVYEDSFSDMLNMELTYYSDDPANYEKFLKAHGFEILLKEHDQPQHLVWIARLI